MNSYDYIQIGIYLTLLVLMTPILGRFMANVFEGRKNVVSFLRPVERIIYKLSGIDSEHEMSWKEYTKALLAFNFIGFLFVFLLQLIQGRLPLNPQNLPDVSWHSALNTAVSFMTNTNWQSYAGETTVSYLVQVLGLAVQNFLSAATGIAVLLALARGISRANSKTIGNFWSDTVKSTVYVLLPLCFVFAIILVSQGVVQTFSSYADVTTLEGVKQTIPLGPAASQIAIKQLGTNGGGFFNANSAHPFENPTPLSNFVEMLALLLIPAALCYTYGVIVKSHKHGWAIFSAMFVMFLAGLAITLVSEFGNKSFIEMGSLMEGKEQRFGIANSVLWSTATTAASNGSVNAMHSSLSPLAGGVAMLNIMLGEVIFGGVGAGLYGILIFVILTVFLAGLMVGRTPEYLGKKIEASEIQMAFLAILVPSALILVGAGISAVLPSALSSLANKGPHGLSEILYAFSSASGNNGSAFAGLNANTPYFNITLAVCMLIGRFGVIIPALSIAGSLAEKKVCPPSSGTFPTDKPLFVVLLISVILIVGALTFFPALCLGPIVEHFLMAKGQSF